MSKTIDQALDALVTAVGGQASPTSSVADAIDALTEAMAGGGALADLSDVALDDPGDGDTLVYDGTLGKWVDGGGALAGLSDVALGTPEDGDVLVYDGTLGKWVENLPEGRDAVVLRIDKTYGMATEYEVSCNLSSWAEVSEKLLGGNCDVYWVEYGTSSNNPYDVSIRTGYYARFTGTTAVLVESDKYDYAVDFTNSALIHTAYKVLPGDDDTWVLKKIEYVTTSGQAVQENVYFTETIAFATPAEQE